MNKIVYGSLLLLLLSVNANAQTTATPASKLDWDQPAASLAEANSLGAGLYVDAAITSVAVTGKNCTGPAPIPADGFHCTSAIPALTPGAHTLALVATLTGAESSKSNSISIIMVIVVAPKNFKIVKFYKFDSVDEYAMWRNTREAIALFKG